jgi:hypothetical protein
MRGEATFAIQWPYLPAAFVHGPTSHIADCACWYVGDVRITKPSCKLLGMLVICILTVGEQKKCAGHAMTVHASGLGPGCALSENAKLPNMQVASLENIKSFVLFIIEYSQAISKKRHPTIWSHSSNFLSSDRQTY